MRIMILQCNEPAPVIHHFRPLMTYSWFCSSRSTRIDMDVASEEPKLLSRPGSVMAKALRILPSRSGINHFAFCSSLPYRAKVSMFPLSGDVQLVACAYLDLFWNFPGGHPAHADESTFRRR